MDQSDKVLNAWRESAQYWDKHRAVISEMLAPLSEVMIATAGVSKGSSVLDVAGGAGEPSLAIAEVVGPDGGVICTDVIPEMLAIARREAERRGLTNITFQQCAAESLPFSSDSFDAVVSRLGAMFFADPEAGLKEMARIARPAGTVTLAVWRGLEFNPFFSVVTGVMSRYLDSPPEDPRAPGAFRFAEHGLLARLLAEAGVQNVRETVFPFKIAAPVPLEDFWTVRSEMSDSLREKISRLPVNQLAQVRAEVEQAAREYFVDNRMSFPAETLIVTGIKG